MLKTTRIAIKTNRERQFQINFISNEDSSSTTTTTTDDNGIRFLLFEICCSFCGIRSQSLNVAPHLPVGAAVLTWLLVVKNGWQCCWNSSCHSLSFPSILANRAHCTTILGRIGLFSSRGRWRQSRFLGSGEENFEG